MTSKRKKELDKIIDEEQLNVDATYKFIEKSFDQGKIETNGTEVSNILPPMNMFSKDKSREVKKKNVIDKLLKFFDKFFSISNNKF